MIHLALLPPLFNVSPTIPSCDVRNTGRKRLIGIWHATAAHIPRTAYLYAHVLTYAAAALDTRRYRPQIYHAGWRIRFRLRRW